MKINTVSSKVQTSHYIRLTTVLLPLSRVSQQTGLAFIQEHTKQPWAISTGHSIATSGPRVLLRVNSQGDFCTGHSLRSRKDPAYVVGVVFHNQTPKSRKPENTLPNRECSVNEPAEAWLCGTGARYLWLNRAWEVARTARPRYSGMPALASWGTL